MLAQAAIAILVGFSLGILLFVSLAVVSIRVSKVRAQTSQMPLVQRVGPILELVPVPHALESGWSAPSLGSRIRHAGLPWNARQYIAFRWIFVWALTVIGLLVAFQRKWDLLGLFLLSALIIGSYYYPEIWLRQRMERRGMEIDLALPDFLDRLTLGLEAGLGFEIALRRTALNFPGLLGDELRYVVRQLDRGHTRSEVLEGMLERVPSQDLSAFVAAVKQTDRLGTSLARTLQVQKSLMRSRRKRRAEEASRRLPILIVFPLVFFFLPALLIIYLAPPLLHLFLGQ